MEEMNFLLRGIVELPGGMALGRRRTELRETLRRAVEDGGEGDRQRRCRNVVVGITRNHKEWRVNQPNRCRLPPGHSVLQTALGLSFDCLLSDSEVVAGLLTEIYRCEGTFEGLFAGAIFGPGAAYLVTGRKSVYASASENFAAVEYSLEQSTKSRVLFDGCRLGEVTLKNVGLTPLEASLQMRNLEMTSLLVKFGVGVDFPPTPQKLLLLCKMRIRRIVHSNWALPFGLGKLPLPESLVSYLETVDSELIHGLLPCR